MAISYVGSNTGTWAGAASGTTTVSLTALTGGSSSTAAIGDLVVAVYASGSTANRTLSITTGYTIVGTEQYANGTSYDANLLVAYKYLTAADTSVTFGATGNTADAGAATVHVFRGVDSANVLDVAATVATGTGTGRPTPPAILPTSSGAYIVMAGGGASATGAVFTAAALSGFRSVTSADTQDATVGAGYVTWTSGTYTPAQWTGGTTNSVDSWAAITLALRPLAISASLTESGTAADGSTSTVTPAIPADITETVTAVDSPSATRVSSSAITEAATATETRDAVVQTYDPTPQAVLYWVGGSGTMASTAGGNWALTSGGTATQFAPSAITDCYFDVNSDAGAPFTVTIGTTSCKSITVSGLDQQMTMTGTGALTVSGSVSLPASNFVSTYTGNIVYNGTYQQSINLNGATFGGNVTVGGGSDLSSISRWQSNINTIAYSPTLGLYAIGTAASSIRTSPNLVFWDQRIVVSAAQQRIIWVSALSLFVSVGNSGTIYTSSDGITWTSRSSGTTATIPDVLWDGSKLVATVTNGVLTSTDGLTWTLTAISHATAPKAIAFDGTTYVSLTASTAGLYYTSTDLSTWTARNFATATGSCIAYSPTLNMFVIGAGTTVYYSTDSAVTWASVAVFSIGTIKSLIWSNSKFHAAGDYGTVKYSANGTSWSSDIGSSGNPNDYLYQLINSTGTTYVGVGVSGKIAYSLNGTVSFAEPAISDVACNDSLYVLVGTFGSLATTSDFVTYSYPSISGVTTLTGVVWADSLNLFVAVGSTNIVLTSPDGVTWTPRSGVTSPSRVWFTNGLLFITTGTNTYYTSPDGINWTSRTGPSTLIPGTFIYFNNLYYANVNSSTNQVYSTPDLVTWTARPVTVASGKTLASRFAVFKGALYGVTSTSSSYQLIKTVDGITWTSPANFIAGSAASPTGVNASSTAVFIDQVLDNSSNYIMYSFDGDNWFSKSSSGVFASAISRYFGSAINQLVQVGACGMIYTSTLSASRYSIDSPATFTGALSLSIGAIDLTSNLTAASYSVTDSTNPKYINLGSTTFNISGTGTVWNDILTTNPSSYKLVVGTSTVALTDNTTTARTVTTNSAFNNFVIGGNTSTSTTSINSKTSCTFSNLSSTKTVAHTVAFAPGAIYNVGNWGIQGSSGNVVSLRRSSAPSGSTLYWQSGGSWVGMTGGGVNRTIYGLDLFVSVGSVGVINTSTDTIAWTQRTSNVGSSTLYGVTYGGSLYVAVGAGGVITTSLDGITWTARTSNTANQLNWVCWTGGTSFMAVGNTGTIVTSPDGITWTVQTSPTTNNLTHCASSGTYHMIGGAAGALYRGADLSNIAAWTADTTPAGTAVGYLDYINNAFFLCISVASATTNNKYSTTNGTTWNTSSINSSDTIKAIAYSPLSNSWAATTANSTYVSAINLSLPTTWTRTTLVTNPSIGIASGANAAYGRGILFAAFGNVPQYQCANYTIKKV